MMDRTLKSLSLLLSYPTRELQETVPEIEAALDADRRIPARTSKSLRPLLEELRSRDIYDLEERYVALFDRSRSLSLNLFEHVHGESRDRGGAMVSLLETYRAGGYEPATAELPDHLPMLLEYLSLRPAAEAREVLADAAHIVEALGNRLERRGSSYAAALDAVLRLAGGRANRAAVAELLGQPEADPDDLQALDEAWEEAEVRFGPDPNAGCPQARELLARMDPQVSAPPEAAAG